MLNREIPFIPVDTYDGIKPSVEGFGPQFF